MIPFMRTSNLFVSAIARPLLLLGASVAASALLACGGEDPVPYSGPTGQLTAITLLTDIPALQGSAHNEALQTISGPFIIDTGSPLTLLSQHSRPSLPAAWQDIALEAAGLRFETLRTGFIDLFGEDGCQATPPVGLLGADVLRHFSLELDYRAKGLTLYPATERPTPLLSDDGGPPDTLPIDLAGGGSIGLDGVSGSQRVGATRLLVPLQLENHAPLTAMIDTGASAVVIRKGSLAPLASGTRPRACCLEVNTLAGPQRVPLLRLESLTIGSTTLTNSWAVELSSEVFDALSNETGRRIDALIGGNLLRAFRSRIHYGSAELELTPFRETSHIDAKEWLLPGFSFCKARDDSLLVLDVFEGTPAATAGIKAGARVLSVGGQSVASMELPAILEAIRAGGAGSTLDFDFATTSGQRTLPLRVDYVLPTLP